MSVISDCIQLNPQRGDVLPLNKKFQIIDNFLLTGNKKAIFGKNFREKLLK